LPLQDLGDLAGEPRHRGCPLEILFGGVEHRGKPTAPVGTGNSPAALPSGNLLSIHRIIAGHVDQILRKITLR
jgi:hypothetical protein